jgi:sugar O-acyltransferase (sialic acid O-acetyltransferase NeuD family)
MSRTNPVVIFGTGPLADVLYSQIIADNAMEIAGFTLDEAYLDSTEKFGLPVVAFEDLPGVWPPSQYSMLVALAYTDLNNLRRRKYEEAKEKGYQMTSFVHSSTLYFPGTKIGENTIILDGNTLQPWSAIGDNVLIWSHNAIGHHARIESHCCITSGTLVGGSTVVGEHSFLGQGAIVRDNLRVGSRVVVGAGCVVLADAPDKSVYRAVESKPSRVPSDRLRSI